MGYTLFVMFVALGLFVGMVLLVEVGRRIGLRRMQKDPEGARAGVGAVEGAIFALLGLLIAFTFSGAAARFDARRQLIVQEANAVRTAYLRLDLLAPDTQPALRESFRRYLDERLEVYRKLPDIAAAMKALASAERLQADIWRQALAACRAEGSRPQATVLLLPALNAMIEISTTRNMATHVHPPAIIFVMLLGLALASALLAGHGMASARTRSWPHVVGFAAAMACAVYVILEIEYPRFGMIRIDAFDQALVELRDSLR